MLLLVYSNGNIITQPTEKNMVFIISFYRFSFQTMYVMNTNSIDSFWRRSRFYIIFS